MDAAQTTEKLVSWIRGRISSAGLKGAVLGMSGGIDSSVLAALCQRAFPRNTLGVLMPCHSCQEDVDHARLVASRLSVPTETVNLDHMCDSLLNALPAGEADPAACRLADANIKARLRMLTLYYLANRLRYLVAGSGNRSELAVGYFTKYGDGGVDIMPLGNLVKEEVRGLARFLDIPGEIIDKPASAGLWPGQTDEAEMGFSYDELDRYLTTGQAPSPLKDKIEAMMAASAHKRLLPPIADA